MAIFENWKTFPTFERMFKKVFRSFSTDAVTNGFLTIFKPSQLQFQLFGEENWGNCHLPIRGLLLQNQHSKILSQKQLHRWKKYWKKVWCHFDGSRKTGLVRGGTGEEEGRRSGGSTGCCHLHLLHWDHPPTSPSQLKTSAARKSLVDHPTYTWRKVTFTYLKTHSGEKTNHPPPTS